MSVVRLSSIRVALVPIGAVPTEMLDFIGRALRSALPNAAYEALARVVPVPPEGFHARRGQFNSSTILAMVSRLPLGGADRILGVADVDLFVPGLNFVFGEAQFKGRAALISLYRLRPEFYGLESNKALFLERSAKEAVHEVGHTLGLPHCRNPRCVMSFSNNILMVDSKSLNFCERCQGWAIKGLDSLKASRTP